MGPRMKMSHGHRRHKGDFPYHRMRCAICVRRERLPCFTGGFPGEVSGGRPSRLLQIPGALRREGAAPGQGRWAYLGVKTSPGRGSRHAELREAVLQGGCWPSPGRAPGVRACDCPASASGASNTAPREGPEGGARGTRTLKTVQGFRAHKEGDSLDRNQGRALSRSGKIPLEILYNRFLVDSFVYKTE